MGVSPSYGVMPREGSKKTFETGAYAPTIGQKIFKNI
jgi:hypothetical protein